MCMLSGLSTNTLNASRPKGKAPQKQKQSKPPPNQVDISEAQ